MMPKAAGNQASSRIFASLSEHDERLLDHFVQLVLAKIDLLALGPDNLSAANLAKKAVKELQESLCRRHDVMYASDWLPVSKLTAMEVPTRGLLALSQV